jgi:hypothetical protein
MKIIDKPYAKTQQELHAIADENLQILRGIAQTVSPAWIPFISEYASDSSTGNLRSLGLAYAPASVRRHHSFEGGLVYHFLEMWSIHTRLHMCTPQLPLLCDKNVFDGILAHDLHKVLRYTACNQILGYDKGRLFKGMSTSLMNDNTLSVMLLPKDLQTPLVANVICCAEGGWAKDPAPGVSSLAKYVYLLDDMSANVFEKINVKDSEERRIEGLPPI